MFLFAFLLPLGNSTRQHAGTHTLTDPNGPPTGPNEPKRTQMNPKRTQTNPNGPNGPKTNPNGPKRAQTNSNGPRTAVSPMSCGALPHYKKSPALLFFF
jgi:hypothetical protein